MPANIRRLTELGFAPLLAKEVAAAINAGTVSVTATRRLAELGMIPREIRELRGQLANTVPRQAKRWTEIGISPRLARELIASMSGGQALSISGSPSPATVGNAYNFTPTTAGGAGTKTFAFGGGAISGLTFSSTTGALSGTPTVADTFTGRTITVTDSSGSAVLPFSLVVTAAAAAGNAALLAALPSVPLVAHAVSSRRRFQLVQPNTTGLVRTSSAGNLAVSRARFRNVKLAYYYEAKPADVQYDTQNLRGGAFAADGNGNPLLWQQIAQVTSGRYDLLDMNFTPNDLSADGAYDKYRLPAGAAVAANVVPQYEETATAAIAGGVAVLWEGNYERGVSNGSPAPWVPGTAVPQLLRDTETVAKQRASALGIDYIDMRALHIQGNSPATFVPIPADVDPGDLVHPTHISALKDAKQRKAQLPYMQGFDAPSAAGSLLASGASTMAGTGGTITGAGLSGVLGDNFTADLGTFSMNGATAVFSKNAATTEHGVALQQRVVIDTSGMAANAVGAFRVSIPVTGLTVGQWYQAEYACRWAAWDGFLGTPFILMSPSAGGLSNGGVVPVSTSNSYATAPSNAVYPASDEDYPAWYPEVGGGMGGAVQATATSGTVSMVVYFRKSPGNRTVALDFGGFIAKPYALVTKQGTINDPRLVAYKPASTGLAALAVASPGATITGGGGNGSTVTFSTNNGADFTGKLLFNQAGKIRSSAGSASVIRNPRGYVGEMHDLGDFIASTEGNTAATITETLTFTPYNPNNAPITLTLTLNNQQLPAGTTYDFTGADGATLPSLYPAVVNDGQADAVLVASNAARNANATAIGGYIFPAEVTSGQDGEVWWSPTSGTTTAPNVNFPYANVANRLRIQFASGAIRLRKIIAGGADTIIGTFTSYKTVAASDTIRLRVKREDLGSGLKWYLRAYQRRVPMQFSVGTNTFAVDVDDVVTACLAITGNVLRVGVTNDLLGGTTTPGTRIDNLNPRPLSTFADRVGLKAPTVSPTTGTAGAYFEATVSGLAPTTTYSVSDPTGTFYADASNTIKCPALPSGGTVVTITQSDPNAENPGFSSIVTITGA